MEGGGGGRRARTHAIEVLVLGRGLFGGVRLPDVAHNLPHLVLHARGGDHPSPLPDLLRGHLRGRVLSVVLVVELVELGVVERRGRPRGARGILLAVARRVEVIQRLQRRHVCRVMGGRCARMREREEAGAARVAHAPSAIFDPSLAGH